jgi:hypothetical protein
MYWYYLTVRVHAQEKCNPPGVSCKGTARARVGQINLPSQNGQGSKSAAVVVPLRPSTTSTCYHSRSRLRELGRACRNHTHPTEH